MEQEPAASRPGESKARGRKRGFRRRRRLVVGGLILVVLVAAFVPQLFRHAARLHFLPPARPALQMPPRKPDPPGIILHSSDSPAWVHGVRIDAARLEKIHADDHPNWATTYQGKVYHIGYHFVILPDGTVQQGRPIGCVGTHARKFNDWLGICLIGDFSDRRRWYPSSPTEEQLRSLLSLCERLMSQYHIPPERVKRHCDVNNTDCPGARFPYRFVLRELRDYAALHPETRPAVTTVVSLPRPHQPMP